MALPKALTREQREEKFKEVTANVTEMHLTLTGAYAGRTFCGMYKADVENTVKFFHAGYVPDVAFDDPRMCPDCLKLWRE